MMFDEIRACLEREGWAVEVVSSDTMRSDFQGAERLFPLFVRLLPPFVVFAVIPFVRLPIDPEDGEALVRRLLRLNREINMAKLSADEEGDVILSVEYRLQDLDPSEVRDAVDVLSFYANKHYAELQELAGP
ncbi:YbjN domain-containing protein [Sorangium sp. So ce1024]|uniref:YbjN domain-containing protein n=1 Tax=Sorangium sp. So ce1024 TaxID=3133327 RepID=UPI003F07B2F0